MAKKRNLTKAKILESARNLAEELGVQQLTFQNLAVDLGIKYPSLYNHFKNIAEVKNALVDLLIQELNDALRRALVGKSGAEAIRIYLLLKILQSMNYLSVCRKRKTNN